MAISSSFFGIRRKSTKDMTFASGLGKLFDGKGIERVQITKARISKMTNPRTTAQMKQRAIAKTVSVAAGVFNKLGLLAYEGISGGFRSLAEFRRLNYPIVTNQFGGAFVCNAYGGNEPIAPLGFQLSKGSLSPRLYGANYTIHNDKIIDLRHTVSEGSGDTYVGNSLRGLVEDLFGFAPTINKSEPSAYITIAIVTTNSEESWNTGAAIPYYQPFVGYVRIAAPTLDSLEDAGVENYDTYHFTQGSENDVIRKALPMEYSGNLNTPHYTILNIEVAGTEHQVPAIELIGGNNILALSLLTSRKENDQWKFSPATLHPNINIVDNETYQQWSQLGTYPTTSKYLSNGGEV